ncbi:MAG: hypothetical protein O7J95_11870 [Planctomycetota bacterium]|nr:hypothetical protein [Planctomycetota bacterium]
MKRSFFLWAIALTGLAAAGAIRTHLEVERRSLGLVGAVPEDLPPIFRQRGDPASVAVVGATLGVFRPRVLNFLWLRSDALKRQGRFFESAALARGITALQPRLPRVWVFQARTLAFDISNESPPRGRFRWVLEAIELLRDRGLSYNPASAELYGELSYLFLFKIGQPFDEAHWIYKDELAGVFEAPPGLPPGERDTWRRETLTAWKIDSEFLAELAEEHLGSRGDLDLRVAETHALYWAEIGLELRDSEGLPAAPVLRHYRSTALNQLLARGRLVRQPAGPHYVQLPDLRFLGAARAAMEDEVEVHRRRVEEARRAGDRWRQRLEDERIDETVEELELFHSLPAVCLALWGRHADAERWFLEAKERLPFASLDELLAARLLSHGDGDEPSRPGRAEALAILSSLIEAAVQLPLTEDDDLTPLVSGLERFARLLHASWTRQAAAGESLPPVELLRRSLIQRIAGRLPAPYREGFETRFAEEIQARAPTPRELGLRGPARPPLFEELGLDFEALDPLYRRVVAP